MSYIDEFDTDREVGGIVYEATQVYSNTQEGKEQAQREAYFTRVQGYYARAMRIKGGMFEGRWACYKSRVRKGY